MIVTMNIKKSTADKIVEGSLPDVIDLYKRFNFSVFSSKNETRVKKARLYLNLLHYRMIQLSKDKLPALEVILKKEDKDFAQFISDEKARFMKMLKVKNICNKVILLDKTIKSIEKEIDQTYKIKDIHEKEFLKKENVFMRVFHFWFGNKKQDEHFYQIQNSLNHALDLSTSINTHVKKISEISKIKKELIAEIDELDKKKIDFLNKLEESLSQ